MKFNKQVRNILKAVGVPKLIRNNLNPTIIGYTALAYFALRALDKRGVLPQQAKDVLRVIDKKIDGVKENLGFDVDGRDEKAV